LSDETATHSGAGGGKRAPEPPGAAFYCVSSEIYFPGAAALINSLRLVGHSEPIFLLDCGLTDAQRVQLAPHATIVTAPVGTPPYMLKTIAPLRHPAETMVLIDADVVVTRPLTEPIEVAAQGRIVAVDHGSDRFFPEWGRLLGLRSARQRRYVSSSLALLGGELGGKVIRLMHDAQPRANMESSPYATAGPEHALFVDVRPETADDPFFFADQDVLNAVLASEVDPERVVALDRRLEAIPPFEGLRVVDESTLRCAYEDGLEPYTVHHLTAKPWLQETAYGVYTQLLLRLLLRRDVAVRLRPRDLPPHLRMGLPGYASRKLEVAFTRLRSRAR
jgi:hypothetical protein